MPPLGMQVFFAMATLSSQNDPAVSRIARVARFVQETSQAEKQASSDFQDELAVFF